MNIRDRKPPSAKADTEQSGLPFHEGKDLPAPATIKSVSNPLEAARDVPY
jgi:hypothetical protein